MRIAAIALVALAALADTPPALRENARAVAIVERSLAAHGNDDLRVSLSVVGDVPAEGQALAVEAPFEAYPYRTDIRIDQPAKKVLVESDSSIAGDFRFRDISYVADGKGWSLTPELKTYTELRAEPNLNRFFPHRILAQALQNRAALRRIDDTTVANGAQTLSFDPKTHLLRRVEQLFASSAFGDARRETLYEDYRRTGNVLLPSRMRVRTWTAVNGTVESVFRYENVRDSASFEDFALPADYAKADYAYRGNFATQKLAEDVYLLENVTGATGQWSYNVLVVVLPDGILIAEAPVGSGTSEKVIAKAKELGGGKPIRWVVQSHHHSDHIAGIRPYVAEGATILAGPSVAPLIGRIAAAPFRLDPDRLSKEPRKPVIEEVAGLPGSRVAGARPPGNSATREPGNVTGSRTIGDRVVIHNIGPSPHARDMLFVHLPKDGIVYQSDMINEGEYPENAATRDFRQKLAALGIDWNVMAGLHGKIIRK